MRPVRDCPAQAPPHLCSGKRAFLACSLLGRAEPCLCFPGSKLCRLQGFVQLPLKPCRCSFIHDHTGSGSAPGRVQWQGV